MCPLHLALYGHPDSGGFWERHCEEKVLLCGFVPIANWKSCFWEEWRLLLTIYVDDFRVAGPREHVTSGWSALQQHLKLGEVEPVGLYLGCMHKVRTVLLKSGQLARRVEYDMSDFLRSCLAKYTAKTGVSAFEKVSTPFLSEQDSAQCFDEEPSWEQLL